MADTKLIHPTLGWSIVYQQGSRLADLFAPDGSCLDCVQVRPWDHARNPSEQEPYTVSDEELRAALDQYLTDQGLLSLA